MAYAMGNAYGSFVRELNNTNNTHDEIMAETGGKIVSGKGGGFSTLGIREAIPRFHDLAYRYEEFNNIVRVVEAGAKIGYTTFEQEKEEGQKNVDTSSTEQPTSTSFRYLRARSMIQDAKYFHCLIDQSQELIAQVSNILYHHQHHQQQ